MVSLCHMFPRNLKQITLENIPDPRNVRLSLHCTTINLYVIDISYSKLGFLYQVIALYNKGAVAFSEMTSFVYLKVVKGGGEGNGRDSRRKYVK